MPDTPIEIDACERYTYYLLPTYGSSDRRFLAELWASTPENSSRTNNAAEAFHSQFNVKMTKILGPEKLHPSSTCSCPKYLRSIDEQGLTVSELYSYRNPVLN